MKYIYSILALLIFISCAEKQAKEPELPKSWQLTKTIDIDGINPIGMTVAENGFWLSDGDHNRLVLIDRDGSTLKTVDSLERPMHIANEGKTLFVPQYGNDTVTVIGDAEMEILPLTDSLDAPAGVASYGKEKAIADFYNHRILYTTNGTDYISFGKEGKAEGDFYYPTDVQITEDKIWVADAYNNRIQVFDKKGAFLKAIGADQKMNAATGIFVSNHEVFVTDFENDRVLVFDHEGVLKQEIVDNIHKPTEMILDQGQLYITNYRTSKLLVFDWAETPEKSEEHDHDHH